MSDLQYDYIVVGKMRNRDNVAAVTADLRAAGKKVYCFLDNTYDGDGITYGDTQTADPEKIMADIENLSDWRQNATFRKIFEQDMQGLRSAGALVMVLPSGLSAHMELGAAYGMGKKCYGIGEPEKPETLYLMFDEIFPNTAALLEHAA